MQLYKLFRNIRLQSTQTFANLIRKRNWGTELSCWNIVRDKLWFQLGHSPVLFGLILFNINLICNINFKFNINLFLSFNFILSFSSWYVFGTTNSISVWFGWRNTNREKVNWFAFNIFLRFYCRITIDKGSNKSETGLVSLPLFFF